MTLNSRLPRPIISIPAFLSTDLSESAIIKARAATYGANISGDITADRLNRFFSKTRAGYEIIKSIRDLCVFAKHNFVSDPPFGKLDLITCRNVLIYLESTQQQRAFSIFHYALKPNGILVLGSSEAVGGAADLYTPDDKSHRFYTKKPNASRLFFDFVGAQQTAEKIAAVPNSASAAIDGTSKGMQMQRDADRYLLGEFVPAGAIVNDQLNLIQFRGKTGPFFEPSPGFANLELLNMLKEGLVNEVRSAVDLARHTTAPVRKENIPLNSNGHDMSVALEVIPLPLPSTGERYFILLFEDMNLPSYAAAQRMREAKKVLALNPDETKALAAVRAELASTKDYLQSVKEEKESANEELKAANEEILSSNEELQSTNEELLTVNDELKLRNQDLTHLNDDLSNLFNSFNSAMVLLTKDLKVRRFTPMAESLLRLLPADIGRSIADIRPNFEIKGMEKMLFEVIATATPKELEVEDDKGKWYAVQMKPYRTTEGKTDGAVLLFTDITLLKTSLIYAEAVESIFTYPLLVLDADLKVKRANGKFYETFKTSALNTENHFLYSLGNGQWNIPELKKMLDKILTHDGHVDDYNVVHDFPEIGRKTMLLTGRRLLHHEKATGTILLAIKVQT